MMHIDTPSVRDQILATVSGAAEPISTVAVGAQAPRVTEIAPGCYPAWHAARPRPDVTETCHGDHHVRVRRRYDHEVYSQLRALERAGLVERVRPPGCRDVYWQATAAASSVALDELEALWNLPAEDPR